MGPFVIELLIYGIYYPKGLGLTILACHASRDEAEFFINQNGRL